MADQIPDSAKRDAIDILTTYVDFIRNEVRADDFERHPYVPHIEQTIEDLRATPPAMDREAVEKVARAMCADDGFDPDEHVIGGQAAGFEDFGPLWQAEERSEGQLGLTNYARLARSALSTLSADAIREGEGEVTEAMIAAGAKAITDRYYAGGKLHQLTAVKPRDVASLVLRAALACQTCGGSGYIRHIGRDNDEIVDDCSDCTPASHASDGGKA